MVVAELMALADTDDDGTISREEHRALFPGKNALPPQFPPSLRRTLSSGVHPTDRSL
jgi:hypothetical protein